MRGIEVQRDGAVIAEAKLLVDNAVTNAIHNILFGQAAELKDENIIDPVAHAAGTTFQIHTLACTL